MKIDDLLQPQPNFINTYSSYASIGKVFLESQKIAIVGLVRNLDDKLENNINQILDCFSIAQDYRLFLFENDSTDNTKNILQKLNNQNTKINFQSETFNREQFRISPGESKSQNRTNALAEYRNRLKDWVKENCSDYDFTIVIDMDFIDFSHTGCYNSFGWLCNNNDIDAIAGSAFELRNILKPDQADLWNYDSWAFRYTWWEDLTKFFGTIYTYDPMLWFGFWKPPVGSSLIKVNSAFGGMVIYRTQKYISGLYEGFDCEHVCFHYNLTKNQDFNLYFNPSQRMLMETPKWLS